MMKITSGKLSFGKHVIHFAGASDTGRNRSHNEDNFAVLPDSKLFCLADGVGGLDAGEVASKRAIEHITEQAIHQGKEKKSFVTSLKQKVGLQKCTPALDLVEVIKTTNKSVYDLTKSLEKKMATTLVALQFHGDDVIICSVGDSRTYLLRQGILGQVTVDHTVAMSFLLAGVPLDSHKSKINAHTITRAIGNQPEVEIDKRTVQTKVGDMFILCSDGLTDMLSDNIISAIGRTSTDNVSSLIQKLINRANEAGGRDNITVIVCTVEKNN